MMIPCGKKKSTLPSVVQMHKFIFKMKTFQLTSVQLVVLFENKSGRKLKSFLNEATQGKDSDSIPETWTHTVFILEGLQTVTLQLSETLDLHLFRSVLKKTNKKQELLEIYKTSEYKQVLLFVEEL